MKLAMVATCSVLLLGGCSNEGIRMMGFPPNPDPAQPPLATGDVQVLDPIGTVQGATPAERYSVGICKPGTCQYAVAVSSKCGVSLDPQYMALRGNGSFNIVFAVTGGAFDPATPITWKQLGGGNTPAATLSNQNRTLSVQIDNPNPGQLKRFLYELRLVDAGGNACLPLDPGIIPDL